MAKSGSKRVQNRKKSCHAISDEIPHILMVSSIFFVFGDFWSNFSVFFLSPFGPAPPWALPPARARTGIFDITRAQRLKIWIFLAHRLRNHHAQLLGRPKSWLKQPLRGPRPDFFWDFGRCGLPKKTQVPQTPKTPKNAKKSKLRQNEAISLKLLFLDPPANVLRLTREQNFFRFWIDGPEIWPG